MLLPTRVKAVRAAGRLYEEMIKSGSLLLLQRRVSFELNVTVLGYDSNIENDTIFFHK